jgi:hypothetical protein
VSRVARHLLLAVLIVSLASCGGERQFTADDVETIVPSAADAPVNTTLRVDTSGSKTLEQFIEATEVRDKLKGLGFKVAYVATFATPAFPADPLKAPLGAALYSSFAVVLRDSKAAEQGFAFYQKRSKRRATDPTPVLTTGFGEDAVAFHFTRLENTALPGIAYLWRVGNVLLSVVGVGVPGPEAAATRTLALTMNRRATAKG